MSRSNSPKTTVSNDGARRLRLRRAMESCSDLPQMWQTVCEVLREEFLIIRSTYFIILNDDIDNCAVSVLSSQGNEGFKKKYIEDFGFRCFPFFDDFVKSGVSLSYFVGECDDLNLEPIDANLKRERADICRVISDMIAPYGVFALGKPDGKGFLGVVECEFDTGERGVGKNGYDIDRARLIYEEYRSEIQILFEALHANINLLPEHLILSSQVFIEDPSCSLEGVHVHGAKSLPLLEGALKLGPQPDKGLLAKILDDIDVPGRNRPSEPEAGTVSYALSRLLGSLKKYGVDRINFGIRAQPWALDSENRAWVFHSNYHREIFDWYIKNNFISIDSTVQDARRNGKIIDYSFWENLHEDKYREWLYALTESQMDFAEVCWKAGYRLGATFVFSVNEGGAYFQVACGCKCSNAMSHEEWRKILEENYISIALDIIYFHVQAIQSKDFSEVFLCNKSGVERILEFSRGLIRGIEDAYPEAWKALRVRYLLMEGVSEDDLQDIPLNALLKIAECFGGNVLNVFHERLKRSNDSGADLRAEGIPSHSEFGFRGHVKYEDRENKKQNAMDFFVQEWHEEIKGGVIYQFQLQKIDPKLLKALKNYCASRSIVLADVLPSKSDKLNSNQYTPDEVSSSYRRSQEIEENIFNAIQSGEVVDPKLVDELIEARRHQHRAAQWISKDKKLRKKLS